MSETPGQGEPEEERPPEGVTRRDDRWHRALGVLVILASFALGWFGYSYQEYLDRPLPLPDEGVSLTIAAGTPLARVADGLAARGLLAHPRWWRWHARLQGDAGRIRAGEYHLDPGTTPRGLLRQLVAGKVVQHGFTIIEGWTLADLLRALHAEQGLEHRLPGQRGAAVEALTKALGIQDKYPEGRFLPDTYFYVRGDSDLDLLRRAYRAMEGYLSTAWAGRAKDLPLKDPYQALILASIVEKETGLAGERPRIAGVFLRRLQRGMRLQTDPTVIYGLGAAFDGNLTRRHLNTDTPYNTYTRAGLPPTPIALPGRASIDAVMHPVEGKDLYFVGKGDGSHAFAATLKEHNANVARYQLRQR